MEPIPPMDPLGLPVPVPILFGLKVFGFFLHMLFMNLWLAGLPTALVLLRFNKEVASRLFEKMPFFMAFGINGGIVPLLFIQTLYPQFFYPATILQAWFWFSVIPLLLIAYYLVYLAAFGRLRFLSALCATILLTWIGLTFSSALSLTAAPEKWPSIFLATSRAGSVHGLLLQLDLEPLLRFFIMAGMAFGTLAVFLVIDAECLVRDREYRSGIRRLVVFLYGLGLVVYGASATLYAPGVAGKLEPLWFYLAGASMPVGALLSLAYWRWPGKGMGAALVVAQMVVLLSNAVARQMVQFHDLNRWFDLRAAPVRGEWGSFFLFVATLIAVLIALAWIFTVLSRSRPGSSRSP